MRDAVKGHYGGHPSLVDAISAALTRAGVDLAGLEPADLAPVDEFHIRGRSATLELAGSMGLGADMHVLDIGSGLGGPARTVAEVHGCRVTGIDLTPAFCEAAAALSAWVGLQGRVTFEQGDATALPYADGQFDAAMTIHAAMNVPEKARLYSEARRVLRHGGIFAVYDVLQGEGGEVLFPVPWAREPSISHLATPDEMTSLLTGAGFEILGSHDSTPESQAWFEARLAASQQSGQPKLTLRAFLGDDYPEMARNQVRNLSERRIRTVSYLCAARSTAGT